MYVSCCLSLVVERAEDNEKSEDPRKRNRFRRSVNIFQTKQMGRNRHGHVGKRNLFSPSLCSIDWHDSQTARPGWFDARSYMRLSILTRFSFSYFPLSNNSILSATETLYSHALHREHFWLTSFRGFGCTRQSSEPLPVVCSMIGKTDIGII